MLSKAMHFCQEVVGLTPELLTTGYLWGCIVYDFSLKIVSKSIMFKDNH